ncbi:MAG: hypothetical protein M3364_05975 [Actinomycetota bacterium]|nr:hypothetical protein [Actinomycetota bacterium]
MTVLRVGKDAVIRLDRIRSGQRAEIHLVRRGTTRATRLATAWEVAPAFDGLAVWLKRYEDARSCSLSELLLDGSERQSPRPIPCSTRLVDSGSGAVLVEGKAILDPNTGESLLETPGLWAIAGDFAIATAGLRGPLTLTNIPRGDRWQLRYPSRIAGQGGRDEAAVQRRSQLVALSFSDPAYQLTGPQVTDLWVLDPATRKLRQLPDMPAAVSLKFTSTEWSSDGRLVILAKSDERHLVALWHPGWKRIKARPIRLPARNAGSDAFVAWPANE